MLMLLAAALSIPAFSTAIQPATTPASDEPASKHWIYFTDKAIPTDQLPAAIADVAALYDAHAARRREVRRTVPGQGLFDQRDLPVAAAYLDQIRSTGAKVHITSRWLNAASVIATPDQLAAIARDAIHIARIEPVRKGHYRVDTVERPAGSAPEDFYGLASEQVTQIDLPALHALGHTGQGVILGILDTGFRTSHAAFNDPAHPLQIVAAYDFVNDDPIVGEEPGDHEDQHRHGTWILGTIAAYRPGELVGGAYDTKVVLCKTEDVADEYPAEEDNYVAGIEFAEMHGADVCTASLGYIDWYEQSDLDGQTAVTTIAVNIATANGVHFCNAAGNQAHDGDGASLIAPADAFQVITCGAVDFTGATADFSSRGPTADGRLKPEVLARGVDTMTVSSRDDGEYAALAGTSLSTPLVAAAVTCLAGAHPDWTVDQLRDYLFRSASEFTAYGQTDPLFTRGYGLVQARAALALACRVDLNHDGVVDFTDYLEFLNLYEALDLAVDFNGDGLVDFLDYLDFLNLYDAGC